jgi:hypothetical protein
MWYSVTCPTKSTYEEFQYQEIDESTYSVGPRFIHADDATTLFFFQRRLRTILYSTSLLLQHEYTVRTVHTLYFSRDPPMPLQYY